MVNEDDYIRTTKKSCKKKRKKKPQVEALDETSENEVILSDAEEKMKQLNLSTVASPNLEFTPSKRKKKCGGPDETLPVKNPVSISGDEQSDEMEDITIPAKKKKRQKTKHLDDSLTIESKAFDKHEAEHTSILHADGDDFDLQSGQESDVILSQSSLSERECEEAIDSQAVEDTDLKTVPLVPLGHGGGKVAKEKTAVQRQLPQWITEADVIPDDISEQSRQVNHNLSAIVLFILMYTLRTVAKFVT